jgi:hypothetical protein
MQSFQGLVLRFFPSKQHENTARIHRLPSLPEIDASHPGKEVVLIEIAGQVFGLSCFLLTVPAGVPYKTGHRECSSD